ncbi:nascent polypeptide-associated complex subunit alpha, muscle-specific form-like isoform X2 [Sparus aurata]|uniref:nascent polypeptide-associated complex subunit alpha, muscle-specific form-like isoform X2 n=1 Tax=Sparus aurata TaxID=8175 RepID=UPI0011C0F157|nr:nascent polypeptide-associated complex subunit alpha, muscle-specific form-like isoform X2 [Sparus aurata]
MSAVKRRGAPEPSSASRNPDFKHHRRLLARPRRPVSTSTCLPDGSARHAHRGPIYVSFVSKAILWERGLCHHTVHERPRHRPLLCPRFLSHMRARSEDLRPPCSLNSKSRPQPPSQGRTTSTHTLAALRTQTLDGFFHPSPDRTRNVVQADGGPIAGSRSAVVVPCPPLPATPPSSTINPEPLHQNTPQPDSKGKQTKLSSVPASRSSPRHAPEEKDIQERETRPVVSSTTDGSATPERSPSLTSMFSHGSLSDLSRPPSSLFSRSTDLASGRSSVLSDIRDSDQEGRPGLSSLQCSGVIQSPLASCPPPGSNPRRSSTNTTTPPVLCEPLLGQTKPLSPRPTSDVPPQTDITQSRRESTKTTENLNKGASLDPGLNPSSDSDRGPITLAFPSTTWSSCPSPQRTTPRSGSGPKLTPSASVTRLESHRWPVLPPISPVRGRCGTAASRSSELSCSQSHVFDELEAIAPRSTSCPSLDEAADSSGCPSPDTELSSGLAALTVGCDSGNLGSLSRVQLLLLDRLEPENLPSPFGMEEEQDWDLREQYDPELEGVLRPLTAGSISERCDSPGKVQENKSDQSEGGSGSPSSWIIDPSPSHDMFRSASPPGSSADDGGPDEEESSYPGWGEEKDRRMEERKTKALSMLSKLQDDRPRRQANANKGRSNFEDFDFLAKYCIFSQEKLAEYKRAFEAEDSDADGYISCLQVLLALKNIIPPELLSDEEEIYVYRILEMVDFRVTDGLVDLRLFAVISSLAQKIATMDEFMRSLISDMDFHSLEVRLFRAKQLFLFLLEEQRGDGGAQQGFISAEQLLLELKAGGIHLEQEAAIRLELQHIPPLDLLDFLAYLPLFMLIHKSVISNPLDDSGNL